MIKILLAEDEISELEWLSSFLRSTYGDKVDIVSCCSNGKDALGKGLELKPDAAFLDIQMPLMTGIDVAKGLKEQDRFINVVFLTAHSNFVYAQEALKLGAFDYLLKPYDPKEIRALMDRLLEEENVKLVKELKKLVTRMSNTSSKSADNPVVRLALDYIEKHYMEKISLEILADDIGFSSSYVSKSLVKHLGKNFNTILLETRCKAAVKLLTEDRLTINEVAYKVGFSDPNYFGKCFKAYMGESPKAYSNKLMGKAKN